jgi:hypothetical protein
VVYGSENRTGFSCDLPRRPAIREWLYANTPNSGILTHCEFSFTAPRCRACYRGFATPRLMSNVYVVDTVNMRALQEVGLPRDVLRRSVISEQDASAILS